jgi:hypothetical protein
MTEQPGLPSFFLCEILGFGFSIFNFLFVAELQNDCSLSRCPSCFCGLGETFQKISQAISLDKQKQWVLQQRTDLDRLVVQLLFDPELLK